MPLLGDVKIQLGCIMQGSRFYQVEEECTQELQAQQEH